MRIMRNLTIISHRIMLAAGAVSVMSVSTTDKAWAVPIDCPINQGTSVCTVTDGNSSFTVGADDDFLAVVDWSVASVQHLSFQSFFLFERETQQIVDPFLDFARFDTENRQITTKYSIPGIFDVTVSFTLEDSGGISKVDENLVFNSFLDGEKARLYTYTNFDLNGSTQDSQAVIIGDNNIVQTDGNTTGTVEVIGGPVPNAFQIDYFPNVLSALGNDVFIDLTNETNGLGPGDLSSAFSWDFDADEGESLEILLRKTIENPLIFPGVGDDPDPTDNIGSPFEFDFSVHPGIRYLIDPDIAVGYLYELGLGDPNFASVILPEVGDNLFTVEFLDGASLVQAILPANEEFFFPAGGVSQFTVLGIETDAMLDPTDPTVFVTGLTFADAGQFTGTMSPIIEHLAESVPEPATILLMISGLVGLACMRRKRQM